jgi:hypothetical protein
LRDLCSDEDDDKEIIKYEKGRKINQHVGKSEQNDMRKEQGRNDTNTEKKIETYTIPLSLEFFLGDFLPAEFVNLTCFKGNLSSNFSFFPVTFGFVIWSLSI